MSPWDGTETGVPGWAYFTGQFDSPILVRLGKYVTELEKSMLGNGEIKGANQFHFGARFSSGSILDALINTRRMEIDFSLPAFAHA